MSEQPRLYLFDDQTARDWAPFTSTRPAGELLYGALKIRERSERVVGARCEGHLCGTRLAGFDESGAPPAIEERGLPDEGLRIFLSSRAVLEFQALSDLPSPARLTVDGAVVGWVVADGAPPPPESWLLHPGEAPAEGALVELEGEVLARPWHLMSGNAQRLVLDIATLWAADAGSAPPGVHRLGDGVVSLGAGAEIEPGVHLDTRAGPIRLEEGVRVLGPARLTGPLYVGAHSVVLGGRVGVSSIGPVCKVHGEITDSVILGYVNKAHDGHLGHAVLGRWVNLGAFTTNSNLKNNYGTVRVWTPEGDVDTGLVKVGCFVGDHVKTGIGTPINTGTVLGAGSNVFGGVMPPTAVPPFSWGAGAELTDYRLDRFLEVAERAMARRDVNLTPGMRGILERAWVSAHGQTTG